MKKLLSLLSVLTISGTAIPTTIATSPYQKQETLNKNVNYQQVNNSENLNRIKRNSNERKFEKWYRFLASDSLKARINFQDAKLINYHYEIENKDNFIESTIKILKTLPKSDHSGAGGSITNDDYKTVAKTLWNKYSLFHELILKFAKEEYNGGITISTRVSGDDWSDECTIFETGTGCDL